MPRVWVVRLGKGGEIADRCREREVIAIGWPEVGDLSAVRSREEMRDLVFRTYPARYRTASSAGVTAGMLWMFAHEISNEDTVLSPKTDTRELMVGKVTGRYDHNTQTIGPDYPHARRVRWVTTRGFDLVPREIWRSMTAWQTVFELSTEVALQATQQILGGEQLQPESQEVRVAEEALNFLTETGERANEILATHFDSFSGMEFQEIVVATLKAAGLFTRPIRRGRDQGIDVEAYRDPLLLGPPRVLVQVKHRQGQVSGPEMREFLGTMNRDGDVGLYISTGGFGREATTAAERHQRPVRLMGWEDFVQMFLRFYDNLDNEFKARVPLENVRVLRPPDETG